MRSALTNYCFYSYYQLGPKNYAVLSVTDELEKERGEDGRALKVRKAHDKVHRQNNMELRVETGKLSSSSNDKKESMVLCTSGLELMCL